MQRQQRATWSGDYPAAPCAARTHGVAQRDHSVHAARGTLTTMSADANTPRTELEPWRQTRDEFHRGKLLHGSAEPPESLDGTPAADTSPSRLGFFMTPDVGMASFYAQSDARNAVANQGDVYATAASPRAPFRIGVDARATWTIVHAMHEDARGAEDRYLDGGTRTPSPHGFVRAAAHLMARTHAILGPPPADSATPRPLDTDDERGSPTPEQIRALDSALIDARLAHNDVDRNRPGWRFGDQAYLRHTLERLGHDAIETVDTDPWDAGGEVLPVTIFLTRPPLTSHRAAVIRALEDGHTVPALVRADYPGLAHHPALRHTLTGTPQPHRATDPAAYRRWLRDQPLARITRADYRDALVDRAEWVDTRDRAARRLSARNTGTARAARAPDSDEDPRPPAAALMGVAGAFLADWNLRDAFANCLAVPVYYAPEKNGQRRARASHLVALRNDGTLHAGTLDWIEISNTTTPDVLIHELVHAQQARRGENMDAHRFRDAHAFLEQESYFEQARWWTYRHREAVEAALSAGEPVAADVLADYPDLRTSLEITRPFPTAPAATSPGLTQRLAQATAATRARDGPTPSEPTDAPTRPSTRSLPHSLRAEHRHVKRP